jgi:hypothetical protein
MEIVIAIMAISFVTVLLSLTTVVSVVITPVVAVSVVVIVIAAVAEVAIIIVGRVSVITIVASVSSWIDTRSCVVHNVVVCASGCASAPTSRARHGRPHGTFIGLNHGRLEISLQMLLNILDFRGIR